MKSIESQYNDALKNALKLLGQLDVASGEPTKVRGLAGWVFEQTVRCNIEKELRKAKLNTKIDEEVPIGGRAKVDLVVGNIAVEIKVSGFYDDVEERYLKYKRRIEAKGWSYFYVTLYETHRPNIQMAKRIWGANRFFILDQKDEWLRFISKLLRQLKSKRA